MKRKFNVLLISSVLCSSILFSSCIGSFGLFNKLLSWNNTIGDKFVNELVFIALNIVPVYGVAMFADMIVLNTVEFWTGSNPVADTQVKKVEGKDGIYTVETSKEGHKITKDATGETVSFIFDETEKTWSVESNGETAKLMKVVNDDQVVMYMNNGSEMTVDLNQAGMFAFKQAIANNTYFASK